MRKHLEFLNLNITKARHSALLVGLFVLAACSDSPTAPQQSIDRVAAARVIPSVTDARMRLAPAIANVAVQQRVSYDLGELENALTNGDGERARFHLRVVGSVLADYRMQQGSTTKDGADVTAIVLMLNVVSPVIDARYELPVQQ